MDTLALGYTLPAIGRVTDLHRLENVHAGRTQKEPVVSGRLFQYDVSMLFLSEEILDFVSFHKLLVEDICTSL